MKEILSEDQTDIAIADALSSIRVIRDVVRNLRTISRAKPDDAPPEVVNLRALVKQVLRLSALEAESIHLELNLPDDLPLLWLPRSRLVQIVTNLVANAGYAMRQIGRPLHRLRVIIREDETSLLLAICDTGIGIPAARLDRMFGPILTTKGLEHGTGLGLFLSREIVRKLGGDLTIDSIENEGTTALDPPLALRTAATTERPTTSKLRPRLMLVDTNLERLRYADSVLRSEYEIVIARSAIEDRCPRVWVAYRRRAERARDARDGRLRTVRAYRRAVAASHGASYSSRVNARARTPTDPRRASCVRLSSGVITSRPCEVCWSSRTLGAICSPRRITSRRRRGRDRCQVVVSVAKRFRQRFVGLIFGGRERQPDDRTVRHVLHEVPLRSDRLVHRGCGAPSPIRCRCPGRVLALRGRGFEVCCWTPRAMPSPGILDLDNGTKALRVAPTRAPSALPVQVDT